MTSTLPFAEGWQVPSQRMVSEAGKHNGPTKRHASWRCLKRRLEVAGIEPVN